MSRHAVFEMQCYNDEPPMQVDAKFVRGYVSDSDL